MSDAPASPDELSIRSMTEDECHLLVEWARAEGWNPGRHDASLYWNADPQAFLAAEKDGELIGGGAVTAYADVYGFMGLFIMRPEFRGRGYGRTLWYARRDALRKRLVPGAPIGMDGVEAMEPFYVQGGFRKTHQDRRFQFRGRRYGPSGRVREAASVAFNRIAAFDRLHFPAPRERFLRGWLAQPGARALIIEGEGRAAGGLAGLGVIRPCESAWKVGPLFAADADTAIELLDALQQAAVDETIHIDIPDTNASGRILVEHYGMQEVFSCARMYLGKPPVVREEQIFGVATFELG